MVGRHGLSRTANALGINYQRLKNRLVAKPDSGPASAGASKRRRGREPSADVSARKGRTRFVELPAFASAADHFVASDLQSVPGECFLEWEDGSGAKLRLRLQGITAPDLAMLCRSFRP
jgi:endonuclease YncB( thermonuclease family)